MAAHGDFVPDSAQNIRDWADHYLTQLPAIATRIAWPPALVAALIAALTIIRDAAQDVLDTEAVLKIKKGLLAEARKTQLPGIRLNTANLKSTSGFTEGDGKNLDVLTSAATLDQANYQPEILVTSHMGFNEVSGKKRGVQSLNIYMRVKGTTTWILIGTKRTTFPFHEDTPPKTPGQPEEREYMAMGVLNDVEIGQPSNIVSAVFRSL